MGVFRGGARRERLLQTALRLMVKWRPSSANLLLVCCSPIL